MTGIEVAAGDPGRSPGTGLEAYEGLFETVPRIRRTPKSRAKPEPVVRDEKQAEVKRRAVAKSKEDRILERHERLAAGQATIVHGTLNGYSNYRCRCDLCKQANTEYGRKIRADAKKRAADRKRVGHDILHGSVPAWESGCRCEPCVHAHRITVVKQRVTQSKKAAKKASS